MNSLRYAAGGALIGLRMLLMVAAYLLRGGATGCDLASARLDALRERIVT